MILAENKWSKYYGEDVFVPEFDENKSVYEAFRDAANKYSDRVAIEFGKRKFTYKELLAFVDKWASVFAANGVFPGTKVMISCRRMPHQIIAFYALNKLGASVCFVMRNARPEVYGKLGEALKASHMIFASDVFGRYMEMFRHTPIGMIIIARSTDYTLQSDLLNPNLWDLRVHEKFDPADIEGPYGPKVVMWKDLEKEGLPEVSHPMDPDEPAVYFSGGVAAGSLNYVKISSRALNAQAKLSGFTLGKTPKRVFSFIRMDFSYGLCFALHTTLLNGHTYLINTQKELEFSGHDINIYKPDIIIGYPQMITSLIDSKVISARALKGIKAIFSCGNIMTGLDYHRIRGFFNNYDLNPRIIRVYGITETCSVAMFLPEDELRPSVIGIPLPGVDVKIVNPDIDAEVTHGQTGVIAINTPAPMMGYINADDDTSTVMRRMNGKTWILTGDLGAEGEDGVFFYSGTRRRVFDRGGMHVYPQFIEDTVRSIFGVDDCCAVPLSRGEKTVIRLAVKPEHEYLFNNDKLNELKENIEKICKMELVEPMCPDEYVFLAYLPTEKYGRVDYEQLQKTFEEEENE